jgi:HSP20 family protein
MSPAKRSGLPIAKQFSHLCQECPGECYLGVHKGRWSPPTDIYEVEDGLAIIMDIAGIKKEEMQIMVKGQVIFISGMRKEPTLAKKYIHQLEIDFGRFERNFLLPQDIDAEKMEARYEDGFLSLWLPRKQAGNRILITLG